MENNMTGSMQNMKFCQSCGMPMTPEQYGTKEDGSPEEKYCCYCYADGKFVQDCTMEEMVEFCAKFEVEGGRAANLAEAKKMLMKYFPALERWK